MKHSATGQIRALLCSIGLNFYFPVRNILVQIIWNILKIFVQTLPTRTIFFLLQILVQLNVIAQMNISNKDVHRD